MSILLYVARSWFSRENRNVSTKSTKIVYSARVMYIYIFKLFFWTIYSIFAQRVSCSISRISNHNRRRFEINLLFSSSYRSSRYDHHFDTFTTLAHWSLTVYTQRTSILSVLFINWFYTHTFKRQTHMNARSICASECERSSFPDFFLPQIYTIIIYV